jgi:hypothetical protein
LSSGNAIVDAIDVLANEVAKNTAAVKAADPKGLQAIIQTAGQNAAGAVQRTLNDNRQGIVQMEAAAKQAREAAEAAIGAGDIMRGIRWQFQLLLALLLVLFGLLGGIPLGFRLFPGPLIVTKLGCSVAGGTFYPAKDLNHLDACAFVATSPP